MEVSLPKKINVLTVFHFTIKLKYFILFVGSFSLIHIRPRSHKGKTDRLDYINIINKISLGIKARKEIKRGKIKKVKRQMTCWGKYLLRGIKDTLI